MGGKKGQWRRRRTAGKRKAPLSRGQMAKKKRLKYTGRRGNQRNWKDPLVNSVLKGKHKIAQSYKSLGIVLNINAPNALTNGQPKERIAVLDKEYKTIEEERNRPTHEVKTMTIPQQKRIIKLIRKYGDD